MTRTRKGRRSGHLVAGAVAVAAIAIGTTTILRHQPEGDEPAPPTTASAVMTTTTATVPTSWQDGLAQLTALQNHAFRSPNADLVDRMMAPSCACNAQMRAQLQALVDHHWHYDGDGLRLDQPVLVADEGITVKIAASASTTGARIVDDHGATVDVPPAVTGRDVLLTLQHNVDGWRIADEQLPTAHGAQP